MIYILSSAAKDRWDSRKGAIGYPVSRYLGSNLIAGTGYINIKLDYITLKTITKTLTTVLQSSHFTTGVPIFIRFCRLGGVCVLSTVSVSAKDRLLLVGLSVLVSSIPNSAASDRPSIAVSRPKCDLARFLCLDFLEGLGEGT